MKIERGQHEDQYRCVHSFTGMLVGLIEKAPDGRWRIEMLMRIDGVASTREEAMSFAKGVWACAEAHNMYQGGYGLDGGVAPNARAAKTKG